jgi:hypothetical protein
MKKLIYAAVTILCFIFLNSCGNTDERTSQAKKALGNKITEESKGVIKLGEFEKTDGKETNSNGMETYDLGFKAKISFQSDGYKYKNFNDFEVMDLPHDVKDTVVSGSSTHVGDQEYFHQGDRIEITGKATFQKKGNGWTIDTIKIMNYVKLVVTK